MVIERINEIISDTKISPEKKLLMFWEQKYINLTEDDRTEEFYVLRNLYFKIADTYENILKSDPSKIDDESLYRKYMIKQRQIGIRMIAAASGTSLENEAKTFESQASGSMAGIRSAANIRNFAKSKRDIHASGGFGSAGASYSGKMSLKDFIRNILTNKSARKAIVIRIFLSLLVEAVKYLIKTYALKKLYRKAVLDENLSYMVGKVAGESVAIKVSNSNEYTMHGYDNYVILSKKIVETFSDDEIIALSLYIHGANRKALSTGIAIGTIRFIISTSVEVLAAYSAVLEIQRTRNVKDALSKMRTNILIKSVVLGILVNILGIQLDIHNAVQFVKSKGYSRQLMNAKQKLPVNQSKNIPNINVEDTTIAVNYFIKFLEIIKFKDSVNKDNISKPISHMNRVTSILKRF